MTAFNILTFFVFILCILLMRRVLIHEIKIFDLNGTISELNEKLNLSDKEYIELFTENMKISEELSSLRVLERIKNL
jgi:uncharacterized membrane protein YGL010W